ncbi:hypothetical protein HK102_009399 [Quaeritorhiza haematococci]|nr:hypothetical protein HK102_009399 [Quaeritorhiza haematococci]
MTLSKPQIITHIHKSVPYTPYDIKWIPCSARFVVIGQHARGTGVLEVYELDHGEAKVIQQTEKKDAFKCGTFGASPLHTRHFATGDFSGRLSLWDLDRTELPVFSVQAHDQIINCIDGCGGIGVQSGPPEIATGSRDGMVKIWDTRQKDKPVAKIGPKDNEEVRDTWAVAFGNSFNDDERMLCAGYDNGDVKMFDLRTMSLLWDTNVKNGVCSTEFDRKDIKMNKLVVTGLEANFSVFDLRTRHPKKGFSSLVEKVSDGFARNYPQQRQKKEMNTDFIEGVMGNVDLISSANVAEQPVAAFDWSPDKMGLCAFTAFDQAIRVGIVTKLNQY